MGPLLTAVGLALGAGWNAPLALLLAGLTSRAWDDFGFDGRFEFLESPWFLVICATWLLAELMLDKLPRSADTNDLAGLPIRTIAGALLFAAVESPATDASPWLAAAAGAVLAGVAAAIKTGARRKVRRRPNPLADLGASFAQDVAVGVGVPLAIVAPPAGVAVLALAMVPAVRIALRP